MRNEILNVKVLDTFLGIEDHGIFTAQISVEGDSWGISYGGWALDSPIRDADNKFLRREDIDGSVGEWVRGVLNALGLGNWEQVKGQQCRVRLEDNRCVAIGHLIKDRWFDQKVWHENRRAPVGTQE